jgi:hypothetical protein
MAASSSSGTGYLAQAVAVADLNGDGLADVAVAAAGGGDLQVLFQRAPGLFLPPAWLRF